MDSAFESKKSADQNQTASDTDSSHSKATMDQRPPVKKGNSKFEDPAWLYETLRKEISKDTSYNLENDAKIRAVTQGTVNYEQFRQMVLGANIRPLENKDRIEGCQNGRRPHVVWNTAAPAVKDSSQNETKVSDADAD